MLYIGLSNANLTTLVRLKRKGEMVDMEAKPTLSLDGKISLAVFAVVFVVYLLTLCPTIYPGPSAEAVCDVKGIGLTPPTGYPIWLILGRLIGSLSSNTAYLLNLMSAFFGALTIALLYAVLSQFKHTRTAEEEARYQTQPYLTQVTSLSAALIVAFSRPFWEGSVLAGSDTLNTFFLVLLVFLVVRYVKTSKSRYAIVFGLVYGLAITNYPTLFLLAPIFALFLFVRGRALLDDPVAVVLMLVLFGVGLLPALYEPRTYVLRAKDYVIHAKTFGLAFSAFVDTYFRSMNELFLQKNTIYDWVVWLFLPTFLPILFFLKGRGEYEQGSPVATTLTYLVRYTFVFLFAVGGLGYLWGYRMGPVGMAGLDSLRYGRYLGSYVIVAAWFSYIIGYWMIVATGKFKATGTEPEPKMKYRKVGYMAGVIIALALPIVGIVMNYGKSTKRHATHAAHFAEGMLDSCPENAIVVVPAYPFYGSIGAPLKYFESQREASSSCRRPTIIDLNAAYFDFHIGKRVNTAQYLAQTVPGPEGFSPRRLFLPEWPFARVYDGILRCETLRALKAGDRPRPICGLDNSFFSSPFLAGNDIRAGETMTKDYRVEPVGLLYVYRSRLEYYDKADTIKKNERLWERLAKILEVTKGGTRRQSGSEVEDYILGEYSKSANDSGVFCQLAGKLDLAEKYYNLALRFSPENSSALWNEGTVMGRRGKREEAEKLTQKSGQLLKEQREREPDVVRKFGLTLDFFRLVQTEQHIAEEAGGKAQARRLGILRFAADIEPGNSSVRERIGDILMSSGDAISVEEARSEYTAALERADPGDKQGTKRILMKLGEVYAKLERNSEAEQFFKKALDADDPSTQLQLMQFYASTEQNPSEARRLATSILQRPAAGDEEKKKLAPVKQEAAILMAKVLLKADGAEKAKEFLAQYLTDQPQDVDVLLTLAAQLQNDPRSDTLTMWLIEKHVELVKDLPVPWLPQLAEIFLRQQRYDDLFRMKVSLSSVPNKDLAQFHDLRGRAYEVLGKREEAEESYGKAWSLLPEDYGNLGVIVANNLAWLCFKNGRIEKAQKVIEEAVAREPANSFIWDTYGWIVYKAGGDLDKALELVEGSHLAYPDVGIIAYHYGKLLIEKGFKERGMAVLERAMEMGIPAKEELEDAQQILKGR